MIHVNHGYVLTEKPTQTTTFQDTYAAVSRPILAPKCLLLPSTQGSYFTAWETQNNVYPIVAAFSVFDYGCEDALIQGAGPITVDALHYVLASGRVYGDFICKFKWYAVWTGTGQVGWQWYRECSYDDGATWGDTTWAGQMIADPTHDPDMLKSYLVGSMEHQERHCWEYDGKYYHVLPNFGIQMNSDSSTNYDMAETTAEGATFGVIIKTEPIAHSDYIHTVSRVVTN